MFLSYWWVILRLFNPGVSFFPLGRGLTGCLKKSFTPCQQPRVWSESPLTPCRLRGDSRPRYEKVTPGDFFYILLRLRTERLTVTQTRTLEQLLADRTAEGSLYEKLSENRVQCHACAHRCRIPEGKKGVCKVRYNEGGKLRVPRHYVGALQVDPIEKKPFFHALPGTCCAFSFGMLGCDYHCDYCQNQIHQPGPAGPRFGGKRRPTPGYQPPGTGGVRPKAKMPNRHFHV